MQISRKIVLVVAALVVALIVFLSLPWFSPSRGVDRAWRGVISAIEDNDMTRLGELMGEDYHDGFGLDRAAALKLAGDVRRHFVVCNIRREKAEVVMDPSEKSAVTRALVRLGGNGSNIAQNAIAASQGSQTPTEFRWRRNSWKPWDWRLVAVHNADAAKGINQLQRQAAQMGLTL